MNKADEILNLTAAFDTKNETLLQLEQQNKQKTNEHFSELYVGLVLFCINLVQCFNKEYEFNVKTTRFGNHLFSKNIEKASCTMRKDGVLTIQIIFLTSTKFATVEDANNYNNELINQILKDLGINVNVNEQQIFVKFNRNEIKNKKATQIK